MAFAPAPDRVVGSKYKLTRKLAGGGMGSVWLARHQTLDVDVAVKLMSPLIEDTSTGLARFEREAKACAQLKSRNIVKVQDYGSEEGTPFMVMELLEGEDLGDRLARVKRLDLKEVSRLLTEVCRGLKVAHDAGIVHRDLKPSNVFLAREGDEEVVKICDFGVARETKTQIVDDKTSSGVVVGSPHHMSPEQAQGHPVDPRSDLWSLGVVVFRALTGRQPFQGGAVTAIMLAIVSDPIPKATALVPELPAAVDEFIERALCRKVDGRFQTATEMATALAAIAAGETEPRRAEGASTVLPTAGETPKEGRTEETQAAVPPTPQPAADTPGEPSPSEATGSRELQAVTSRVTGTTRTRLGRATPLIALAVGVGALGFYFGRRGDDEVATPSAPVSSVSANASTERPPEIGPTAEVSAVASAPVPSVASADGNAGSASAEPAPRPTPSGPVARKIDPFTGLPVP